MARSATREPDRDRVEIAHVGVAVCTAQVVFVSGRVEHQLTAARAERVGEHVDHDAVFVPFVEQLGDRTATAPFDLGRGPRISGHSVEAALDEIGGDAREVGDDVVDGPVRGCGHRPGRGIGWCAGEQLADPAARGAVGVGDLGHPPTLPVHTREPAGRCRVA